MEGHEGLLSVYDTAAYKPIVCLTSTSYSRTATMVEKVNYCTQGKAKRTVSDIERTVSFEAEFAEPEAAQVSYDEVGDLMETKEEQYFKLEGRGEDKFLKGIISSLSDTFQAGEDATFSGELTINEVFDTDPNTGG